MSGRRVLTGKASGDKQEPHRMPGRNGQVCYAKQNPNEIKNCISDRNPHGKLGGYMKRRLKRFQFGLNCAVRNQPSP
jgi:hypothetical protein